MMITKRKGDKKMMITKLFQKTQQTEFMGKMEESAKKTIELVDSLTNVINYYWGNGFNSGGANEITDVTYDGTNYEGVTAEMVTNALSVLERIKKVLGDSQLQALMKIIK